MVTENVTCKNSETSVILKLFPEDPVDCGNLKGRPGARFIPRFFDLWQDVRVDNNLIPRVSPLHAPGSERGETLVGAGHVSPREKLDPGRGPSPASLCQYLLSTPKRGFRFAARSPRETHSTGYVFFAKQVRCLEALYFGKDVVAALPKGYGKIMIFHLLHSQCYGISS